MHGQPEVTREPLQVITLSEFGFPSPLSIRGTPWPHCPGPTTYRSSSIQSLRGTIAYNRSLRYLTRTAAPRTLSKPTRVALPPSPRQVGTRRPQQRRLPLRSE